MGRTFDTLIQAESTRFAERTPTSAHLARRAHVSMPLGVGSSLHAMDPYPLVIATGRGAWVHDADGNAFADFHAGHGTMVCGHANAAVTRAIASRATAGIHFGTLTQEAISFAEALQQRFGPLQVQMTNSGTEATQLAIRIARSQTGRDAIVKVEGGYHGAHDPVMVSTHPSLREAGPDRAPSPVAWGRGIPEATRMLTQVVPFNDLAATEAALVSVRPACLIVEPVLLNVGFIAPLAGYHDGLRDLCDRHGVLLIHDEVKTGMTLGYGGAKAHYRLRPDLLCLGKGIGGGLAVGAVMADELLMEEVASGDAPHYGTFAANPLVCAAGHACLTEVMTPEAHGRIAALNQQLVSALGRILRAHPAVPGYAVGEGGKGTVVFARRQLVTYRDWETHIDHDLGHLYWLCLTNDGVLLSPGQDEQWTLTAAHDKEHLERFVASFERFCTLAEPALAAEE